MPHDIIVFGKKYTAPSGWEELTTSSILLIAIHSPFLHADKAKDHLIRMLANIPKKDFRKLKLSLKCQLRPLLNWLEHKNKISKWLLPTVQGGKYIWKGPLNHLSNLTAEQFMYAELAYERWLQTYDDSNLDDLFVVLFQRYGFLGLIPLKFNASKFEARLADARPVRDYIKRAVALNYAGCRNFIIDRHPHIWRQAVEQGADNPGSSYTPWGSMILDLAGDKFGTYDQTLRANVWNVLADLDKKAQRAEELEALNK